MASPRPFRDGFCDRVVLVTGGTSGIGAAIAEALLAAGAHVAVCGRSQSALDAVVVRHPAMLAIRADVTSPRDRHAMIDTIATRFGRLDILVNNAGVMVERDFAAAGDPCMGIEAEVAVNLTAPIALTGAALGRWPTLKAVVLVSSGYALVSPRRAPTYGAVKAGLHGFADGLRRQLDARGVQVLEVLPPLVDTPATAGTIGAKISAAVVAEATLAALRADRAMALPGQTRFLPSMLRLAPGLIGRMVSST